ncbi:phosphonate metabolism transcriptional regulator PhnF [Phreatobacter sp. AB_2022a]|uniref:phosphonate metabolism transcriptional regulator PhnF n=1 Tax=Phreatobacter sp. AB_2022a TaxID=3003134 RepID=UPI002286D1AF|nr:phosphonate metabolism transcriptional regulator PhnF [Phreatobacter sp. AB_2022a]MCZ0736892.1 phosphonate metabolism transcriptional regulator PhnF [Phreatobacter sp. AB_2022a]
MAGYSSLDRPPAIPLWRQIELALLSRIERGDLKIGERLPGENVLAPTFGVTRNTVRRALAELALKGLVRIEHGRGAFIERKVFYGLGQRSTFRENLRDNDLFASSTILECVEIPASPDVADKLEIAPGAPVVVFQTVGRASGMAVSVTNHHLRADLFPDAAQLIRGFSCISEVYARFGFTAVRRARCEISAALPSPEEARHLEQSRTSPILEVRSVKVSALGVALDYTLARFCSERVSAYFENE